MALSKILANSITDGAVTSAKLADFAAAVDLNGVELLLDADQDTSITADTDDRIDFKIAGVEHFSFSNSSGDTVVKPMVDGKDIIFQQYDGNKLFEINDGNYVGVHGAAAGPGEIRIYEDTDLGSHYTGFKAGNNTASLTYILPTADGVANTHLTTNGSGTLSWAAASFTPASADGSALGSASLEFSDLYLADGGVVYFGNDQDVTLTHNADTGLTLNGVLVTTGLTIGSAVITEAELEILDGLAATTAELAVIDGDTSATSTTVADADRVVLNDNGTMVQVAVTDLAAYFDDEITAMPNLVSTGALNSGTITSGFGSIDNGSSAITTTGTITGGVVVADDVNINGKVITMTGSSSDTATLTAGTNGTLDIVTTDAGGAAANIQITADGTAEMAGTTVTLDSSGGITLDADGGTITFADGGSSLGTITSSGYSGTAAVATTVTVTDNEDTNENNVLTFVAGADSDGGNVGLESDGNLTYNPSTGTLTTTNIVVSGTQTITNSVTMNANNAVVFEGSTADANETTLTSIDATGDRTISLPNVSGTLPVLAAVSATAITSTPEELNILDGVTSTAAELNIVDGGTSATSTTVADADRVVMNDGGTMVQVAVTDLAAYFDDEITAMPNLTSVGTLTALTVDDVAVDGKVITMTGSSGDTFVTTVGTNGATSLVTTDASAAAANLTITADGTVGINSTGDMTLDSSTNINLDADGGEILFNDGGTNVGKILLGSNGGDFILSSRVSDKDFVVTGNDGGSMTEFLRVDSSAGGDLFLAGGLIDLKNDGTAVSQIKFYCESSNAHAQTLIGAPHSESATNTLTLPSTGGNSYLVSAASTATLTNKTLTAPVINTATVGTSITPASDDGATLGSANLNWSDLYLADSAEIFFGDDQDFSLKQVGDGELSIKRNSTSDDSYPALFLDTGETDIANNDILGAIHFRAPDEAAGTDAILSGASIIAASEGDFSASNNATTLSLRTGNSGTPTTKLSIKSAGDVNITEGDLIFGTSGKGVVLGATSNTDANTLDDYEEGSYTPALRGGTTTGSATYHSRQGSYTKIGNTVHIQGGIHCNSMGGLDGYVYVTGLPFAAEAQSYTINFSYAGSLNITGGTTIVGYTSSNDSEFIIRHWDASGGTSNLDDGEFTDGAQIIWSGMYKIS